MAERRMFSKAVTNSARFLQLPGTARLLYFDLGMAADDDGVVEAFTVMRTTGAAEDDLQVLAAKGFVQILNRDLVSYITDWTTNNQIRKDRYHSSIYAPLLPPEAKAPSGLPDGNQMATKWQPNGNQMATSGKPSLGKSSLGKSSLGKDSPGKDSLGKERIEQEAQATAVLPGITYI